MEPNSQIPLVRQVKPNSQNNRRLCDERSVFFYRDVFPPSSLAFLFGPPLRRSLSKIFLQSLQNHSPFGGADNPAHSKWNLAVNHFREEDKGTIRVHIFCDRRRPFRHNSGRCSNNIEVHLGLHLTYRPFPRRQSRRGDLLE